MTKVAVFGAGSWGTAFGLVLADAGQDVTIWARRPEVCADDQRTPREHRVLPRDRAARRRSGRPPTPPRPRAGAEFVVLSVPSQKLRENLGQWTDVMPDDAVFVSLMKGVELGTTKRMSEVIAEVTGAGPDGSRS